MPRVPQWICIVCLHASTMEPRKRTIDSNYRIDRCPFEDCPSRKKSRGKGETTFRLE